MPTDLGTPQTTELLVRLLSAAQYLGLLTFAGLWFFRDFLTATRPEGAGARRLNRTLLGVASAGILASLLLIPALGLRIMGNGPASIWQPPMWSPGVLPANLTANLLAAGALLGAGLLALTNQARQPRPNQSRLNLRWFTLPAVLLALFAPALNGHTTAANPAWVAHAANTVHLAAGAIWLGGLIGLGILVGARSAEKPLSPQAAVTTLARFSNWALGAVVAVGLSGVALGATVISDPNALTQSTYGRTLLFKVTIVVAVIGLAGWNRVVLVPRLRRATSDTEAWRLLHQTLDYEALLLVCVLIVTGFLANLNPSTHDHGLAASPQTAAASAQN